MAGCYFVGNSISTWNVNCKFILINWILTFELGEITFLLVWYSWNALLVVETTARTHLKVLANAIEHDVLLPDGFAAADAE